MRLVPLLAIAVLAPMAAPLGGCAREPVASTRTNVDPALDALFAKLKAADTPAKAAAVEQRIWEAWGGSGSATVDVLVERADAAEAAGDPPLARRFIDEATALMPELASLYYRRSILRYETDDRIGAIRDIKETLKREPRHFGALTGLGTIYEDLGQDRAALDAYRKALTIHPFMEEARRGVARLEPKVEGREI